MTTGEINALLGGAIGAAPPSPGGESAAVPDGAATAATQAAQQAANDAAAQEGEGEGEGEGAADGDGQAADGAAGDGPPADAGPPADLTGGDEGGGGEVLIGGTGGGSNLLGLSGPSGGPSSSPPPAPTVEPVPPDSPATISITDVSISESAGIITFTLTRAGGIGASSVTFQTADGTATAGSDYVATTSTVSFAGGLTTSTVTVSLIDDQEVEGDETFAAVLSPVINAQIGDGTGTGTILNDDVEIVVSGGTFTIAVGTQGSENPGNATFIVTRSGTTSGTVTVNFATTAGTATAGTDFTATSGTLTFASGVTSQTITVPVLADTAFEGTERFTVTLSDPGGGATISGSAAIEGRIYYELYGGKQPIRWRITTWANVSRRGHYNRGHVHPGCTWSGVYYVDAGDADPSDRDSGLLVLQHPIVAATMTFFPGLTPDYHAFRPVSGLMVAFPSYLGHEVQPYGGDRPRISIAFNIKREPFLPDAAS